MPTVTNLELQNAYALTGNFRADLGNSYTLAGGQESVFLTDTDTTQFLELGATDSNDQLEQGGVLDTRISGGRNAGN